MTDADIDKARPKEQQAEGQGFVVGGSQAERALLAQFPNVRITWAQAPRYLSNKLTSSEIDNLIHNLPESELRFFEKNTDELTKALENYGKGGRLDNIPTYNLRKLVDGMDEGMRARFLADFKADSSKLAIFERNPGLVDSWNTFKNAGLDDLARDVNVLESYSKVKRVGSYTEHVKPTRVSELTRAHGAPKLGQEADILKHKTTFSTTGYDLSKPIPVIELPDGTLLLADGHHRLKAMENLEQVVVPVDKLSIYEAKQLYGEDGVATLVKVAKLSGNYKGTYTGASGLALERAQNAATDFMNTFFPGW